MASIRLKWSVLPALLVFAIVVGMYGSFLKNITPFETRSKDIADVFEKNNNKVANHSHGCLVNVSGAWFYSQSREDRALYSHYFSKPQVCRGTFVEIGALDGVKYSNTKFFEDNLGWTGVLIEAQPQNARKLKRNRPKATVIAEAVCPEGQNTVDFIGTAAVGGIPKEMTDAHKKRWISKRNKVEPVPCSPIGRMLRDSGVLAVDLFSVDVEGAELLVLQTMDWTIPVKVFVVEMGRGREKDAALVQLLAHHGYKMADWNIRDYCPPHGDCANNQVFENTNYVYTKL